MGLSGGEWPALILGLLWLAFLGSGVAYYFRGRFTQAVQSALIWVLIFLGFTLAYGLREPLATALNLQPTTSFGEEITLIRDTSGHFATRLELNGTPVPFIVDTGASEMVLSPSDARRIGLDLDALNFSGQARTANGTVATAPVRLTSVRFGPYLDENVRATVNSAEMGVSLLGMSYLNLFDRIVVEGDRMTLTR